MKRFFLVIFLILTVTALEGQTFEPVIESQSHNYPTFYKEIQKSFEYPLKALYEKISGRVFISISVSFDSRPATITEIKLVKGVHPILDSAALRLVRSLPNIWKGPARGKAEPITLVFPIIYDLEKYYSEQLENSRIVFVGRLLDYYTREPLINSEIKAGKKGVLTDVDGLFYLSFDPDTLDSVTKVIFSQIGYIEMKFRAPNDIGLFERDFYMIPIEPFPHCVSVGGCSDYERIMPKIWIKKRRLIPHDTPLNWRLECSGSNGFEDVQDQIKISYSLHISPKFHDYRKYGERKERDYFTCRIEEQN